MAQFFKKSLLVVGLLLIALGALCLIFAAVYGDKHPNLGACNAVILLLPQFAGLGFIATGAVACFTSFVMGRLIQRKVGG